MIELWDEVRCGWRSRDDGAGFDPQAVTTGVGFASMRDRLDAVGGRLAITSSPGRGTRVAAAIPL